MARGLAGRMRFHLEGRSRRSREDGLAKVSMVLQDTEAASVRARQHDIRRACYQKELSFVWCGAIQGHGKT